MDELHSLKITLEELAQELSELEEKTKGCSNAEEAAEFKETYEALKERLDVVWEECRSEIQIKIIEMQRIAEKRMNESR